MSAEARISNLKWLIASALLPLAGGCMTAKLDENRMTATHIEKGEAIVILAKPQVEGTGSEDEFMHCVGDKLASSADRFSVVADEEFQDTLFPWFEPSVAPVRAENITQLLERPKVSRRLEETGVRYIVWLDGNTRKTDGGGSLACGAAPGLSSPWIRSFALSCVSGSAKRTRRLPCSSTALLYATPALSSACSTRDMTAGSTLIVPRAPETCTAGASP